MVSCPVYGCSNTSKNKNPAVTFHRFPLNPERRDQWVNAIRRKNWYPTSTARICSVHFREEDMDRTSLSCVRIRENAVPSIFPEYASIQPKEEDTVEITMPGCSAVNCTNSSAKGFSMKNFPRDPSRRKEWLMKMNRVNWTPTDHSTLCEVHFAPEMWEKIRVDGKKKLKCNAVPTIFSSLMQKHERKQSPRNTLPLNKLRPSCDGAQELTAKPEEPSTSALLEAVNLATEQTLPSTKSCFSENTLETIAPVQRKMLNSSRRPLILRKSAPAKNPRLISGEVQLKLEEPTVPTSSDVDPLQKQQLSQSESSNCSRKPLSPKKPRLLFGQLLKLPLKIGETSTPAILLNGNIVQLSPSKCSSSKNNITTIERIQQTTKSDNKTPLMPKNSSFAGEEPSSLPNLQLPPSKTSSNENTDTVIKPKQEAVLNPEITELQIKLQRYEKYYIRERIKAHRYRAALRQARNKLSRLAPKGPGCNLCESLRIVFGEDQLIALNKMKTNKSTKLMKWSDDTIAKSLKLKSVLGNNGYSELIKLRYPLPSIRTLQRKQLDQTGNL